MNAPSLSARELSLLADTDVVGHIRRENAERQAQMDADPGLFCMMVAESVAEDCANVYEYERDMAWNTYSDVHKERYGFRPRHDFSTWTLEDFERANTELFEDYAQESADMMAEDTREEYWAEEERREAAEAEEYRLIAAQEERDRREDQQYDEQDRLSGV